MQIPNSFCVSLHQVHSNSIQKTPLSGITIFAGKRTARFRNLVFFIKWVRQKQSYICLSHKAFCHFYT